MLIEIIGSACSLPNRRTMDVNEQLQDLGVDILEPCNPKEETMAKALEEFSTFVLNSQVCRDILDEYNGSESVGELQGGNESYGIYRANLFGSDTAAEAWIREFHHSSTGRRYANVLTIDKLQQYMLSMCHRRSQLRGTTNKTAELGNLMFILATGPTHGQVRHIDQMDPNLQVCLYMSQECPMTVIYEPEGPAIASCADLLDHWDTGHGEVPELVRTVLMTHSNIPLKEKKHTKYFSFWDTLEIHLKCFGKLYQPIARVYKRNVNPGTMLIAGGNEIHAGPPTTHPRMFCFAIGIDKDSTDDDRNGEIQYNPVLLHLDLCCIIFSILQVEYPEADLEPSKRFLLDILVDFVKEFPNETYARLLGNEREGLRTWLGTLVVNVHNGNTKELKTVIEDAVTSCTLIACPGNASRRKRKGKKVK
jgi:hypothetical protein